MTKLVHLILRVGMWAAFGAILGATGVVVVQVFFQGGALGNALDSSEIVYLGMAGAAAGGLIGFFRKN
jgi:hypothetical protein